MWTSSPKWSRKSVRRAGGAERALLAVLAAALLAACGDPPEGGNSSGGGGGGNGGVNWGPPTTLAADLLAAGAPVAAIDDAGLAAVLWSQPDFGAPARPTLFARLRAAADWSATEPVETLLSTDAAADLISGLQAEAPATGIAALWARRRPSAGDVLRSVARESNGWSFQAVPTDVGVTVREPAFAANAAGVQAAAWVQEVGGVQQVVLSTRRLGAGGVGWGTLPLRVQADPVAVGSQPAVAVDAAGTVMIAWRQGNAPGRLFSRSYSVPSGIFGALTEVNPPNLLNDVRNARVLALAAGIFLVAWEQADGGSVGAYSLLSKQGTVNDWAGDPVAVDAQVDGVGSSLLLAGPTQSAIALWQQGGALFVARRPAGGPWSVPAPIGAGLAGTPSALRAAADASGNAIAVWLQQPAAGGANDLYFALLPAANVPLAPTLLETDSADASAPALAVNAAGAAVVAWLQPAAGQVNRSLVARIAR